MAEPGIRTEETSGAEPVRADFDFSQVSPTTAIVETVATATGQDVLAMEPLAESVPTDPLDDLFRPDRNGSLDSDAQLTVTYSGYRVTIDSGGTVVARPV